MFYKRNYQGSHEKKIPRRKDTSSRTRAPAAKEQRSQPTRHISQKDERPEGQQTLEACSRKTGHAELTSQEPEHPRQVLSPSNPAGAKPAACVHACVCRHMCVCACVCSHVCVYMAQEHAIHPQALSSYLPLSCPRKLPRVWLHQNKEATHQLFFLRKQAVHRASGEPGSRNRASPRRTQGIWDSVCRFVHTKNRFMALADRPRMN